MPPGWRQFLPLPFEPPDDIRADTQSRLPPATPRPRTPGGERVLYSRGLAPVGTGPGLIRGHSPDAAALENSVGRALVDLAVLIAARAYDAQYLWTTTEPAAREHGLEPAVIDVVRNDGPTAGLPERTAALIEFGRELLGDHTVRPPTYARAQALFGTASLVGLVNVMGATAEDATLLAAFDQRLPAGATALLPMR
jgi:4-carboxymuconolactone decarboxylase